MKYIKLLSVMLLMLTVGSLHAQDMILKKNNEIIKCKIKEIGLDEVKYTIPEYSAEVTFSIDKDNLTKVIFENGKEMEFQKAMTDPANYIENKKNSLEVEFMSPITGNLTFAYERSLKPGRSMEGTLGLIGLGVNVNDENAGGAFVKFGYKFIKDPDFYLRGMKYAHILKGAYVKPEIALGLMGRDYYDYYNYGGYYDQWGNWIYQDPQQGRETVFSGTIQLVIGKQWVFDNAFLVDWYGGVGYGFTTQSNSDYDSNPYYYGYTIADAAFPISFSAGLRLGYLFK
ncbi:MAG: hypothetical protein Q8T08_03470 [Ignavibacteria bacterium]|nr:hypothetical protein [Ignavibacteria bacterium]